MRSPVIHYYFEEPFPGEWVVQVDLPDTEDSEPLWEQLMAQQLGWA